MHSLNKNIYVLAMCLSALAGCIDAIGFLQLGGYFISFMSGNSTRFAISIVSGDISDIALLAIILSVFVIGSMLGMLVRLFSKASTISIGVLVLVTAMLAGAAISSAIGWVFPAILLMILAMGAENAILQRHGEMAIGLTYMTGALVKMGQLLAQALLGGGKLVWYPYLLLWVGLIIGGVTGAASFYLMGMQSLWLAACWALGLILVAHRAKHTT